MIGSSATKRKSIRYNSERLPTMLRLERQGQEHGGNTHPQRHWLRLERQGQERGGNKHPQTRWRGFPRDAAAEDDREGTTITQVNRSHIDLSTRSRLYMYIYDLSVN